MLSLRVSTHIACVMLAGTLGSRAVHAQVPSGMACSPEARDRAGGCVTATTMLPLRTTALTGAQTAAVPVPREESMVIRHSGSNVLLLALGLTSLSVGYLVSVALNMSAWFDLPPTCTRTVNAVGMTVTQCTESSSRAGAFAYIPVVGPVVALSQRAPGSADTVLLSIFLTSVQALGVGVAIAGAFPSSQITRQSCPARVRIASASLNPTGDGAMFTVSGVFQ